MLYIAHIACHNKCISYIINNVVCHCLLCMMNEASLFVYVTSRDSHVMNE